MIAQKETADESEMSVDQCTMSAHLGLQHV
eukprot:SAG31_NODE_955_length_10799_cov_6.576636_4_plen_30_part_00